MTRESKEKVVVEVNLQVTLTLDSVVEFSDNPESGLGYSVAYDKEDIEGKVEEWIKSKIGKADGFEIEDIYLE